MNAGMSPIRQMYGFLDSLTKSRDTLKINWQGNGYEIVSVSSYFRREFTQANDLSTFTPQFFGLALSPVPYESQSNILAKQTEYTQELRIASTVPDAKLRWIVGGFYQYSPFYNIQSVYDPQLPALTAST